MWENAGEIFSAPVRLWILQDTPDCYEAVTRLLLPLGPMLVESIYPTH